MSLLSLGYHCPQFSPFANRETRYSFPLAVTNFAFIALFQKLQVGARWIVQFHPCLPHYWLP